MPAPKLTYFDFPGGRGEECRLALHVAGIEFEDNRIKGEAWRDLKSSTPYGALPILEVDGKPTIAQSNAILRLIGTQHGLLPADAWEAARHEAALAAVEDLRAEIELSGKIADEDEKAKARQKYVGHWVRNLEAQIEGPFFGGDELSVADLKLYNVMKWFKRGGVDHVDPTVFDDSPKLTALFEAVDGDERVKDWYARG
jgi:glutathione S-transferase